jgi:hypothetical protein
MAAVGATVTRLLLHPILSERAAFLFAVIAVAVSAHFAGFWSGIATMALTIPLAAVLFLPWPGSAGVVDPWVQGALAALLSVPLAALGGRFHAVVRALSESLQREHRLLDSERAVGPRPSAPIASATSSWPSCRTSSGLRSTPSWAGRTS